MQRENEDYYNDNEVFETDVEKFKDIVSTIDIAKHSQREFCLVVDEIYKEIFQQEENNDDKQK